MSGLRWSQESSLAVCVPFGWGCQALLLGLVNLNKVCTCVHTHAHTHVCKHVHMCTCVLTHTCAHTCIFLLKPWVRDSQVLVTQQGMPAAPGGSQSPHPVFICRSAAGRDSPTLASELLKQLEILTRLPLSLPESGRRDLPPPGCHAALFPGAQARAQPDPRGQRGLCPGWEGAPTV